MAKLFMVTEGHNGDTQEVFVSLSEKSVDSFIAELYIKLSQHDADSYYRNSFSCYGEIKYDGSIIDRLAFFKFLKRNTYTRDMDTLLIADL